MATPPGFDDADDLIAEAVSHGREVLHELLTAAVTRQLSEKVHPPVQPLFTPDDRATLADLMTRVAMAGDLTGRVRVVKFAGRMRAKHRRQFAAGTPELTPPALPPTSQAALDFFAGLIPRLGLDPRVYGPLMERHAFTLAVATERTLVKKVQAAIADYLRTDWEAADAGDKPSGAAVVQAVLDRCGVTPSRPDYSDMVFRTNVMDALNTGVSRQLATPEMREDFPAWRYLGIDDGREGDDHRPKFGKLYPTSASFAEVRGPRPFNCRCSAQPIHAVELEQLLAAGERIETNW